MACCADPACSGLPTGFAAEFSLCAACDALQKQRQLLEWQAARSAGDEAGTLAAAASLERQDSAGSGNEPMEVRYAAVWEVLPPLESWHE